MNRRAYLFDTHALLFWANRDGVSEEFVTFFDRQDAQGRVHVSSMSIWEIALLVRKARLEIADVHAWKNDLLAHTQVRLIGPTEGELIDSTQLPDHHSDPFDRALIAQARHRGLSLVSKDARMAQYDVELIWM